MANTQQHLLLTKVSDHFMETTKHLIQFLNSCFLYQISDECYITDQLRVDRISIFYNFDRSSDDRFKILCVKCVFDS